ncbi:hypothetical protein MNBD_GAMMA12-707 [hydrothermal vent metagenome]|uniref:Metal-dependent hydrolase n=1 Tax=hydrothermal vent metagenome TaxID=652676 RepID=A0A3B0Z271_9ZZZZ
MFIAHLPAAYLLTRAMIRRANRGLTTRKNRYSNFSLLLIGLVAGVFPDLDLMYFYWVDGRQNNHHLYWTHVPVFWVLFAAAAVVFLKWINATHYLLYVWVFIFNIILHLVLDTLVGGILWFFPLSMELIYLIKIPSVHAWWVANFLWHWTFLLELIIFYVAMLVYARPDAPPKMRKRS